MRLLKLHKNNKEIQNTIVILLIFLFSSYIVISQDNQKGEVYKQDNTPEITSEDSLHSIRIMQKDIIDVLKDKSLDNNSFGIAIYSLDTKKYYYRKNADMLLTPASNTKIITTFSALFTLGTNYQVKTSIYADGEIKNGVLNGNLYIYGRGDALLSISDIEYLADKVRNYGINEITGNIIADGSYFDDEVQRHLYSNDKDIVEALQPITALSLEKNIVQLIVTSGTQSGRPVGVQIIPASDAFNIANQAKVIGGARPERKQRSSNQINNKEYLINQANNNDTDYSKFFGDSKSDLAFNSNRDRYAIKVSTKMQNSGIQQFTITGSLEANSCSYHSYHINKPCLVVAGALKNRLTSGGVNVKGNISEGLLKNAKSGKPTLVAEFGRPLLDIIIPLNKNSDNYLAETLFKIVGANSGKLKDNAKEAQQIELNILDSLKINCEKCAFNDGSGLSRRNLTTANTLLSVLIEADKRFGKSFDTSLSIAGVDGTLRNRLIGTGAENNLHGKTGTLGNVSSLSGYVTSLDNERFAFAFIFNGSGVGNFKRIEDKIGEILSQFFYFNKEN